MEIMQGKHTIRMSGSAFADLCRNYRHIHVDLGTGDGRYARSIASTHPDWLVVGIDACRENLRAGSRLAPENALFVIANACALPLELGGIAREITVNFPWGSLLTGLLDSRGPVLEGMCLLAQPDARLRIRLNADGMAAAGWELDCGVDAVAGALRAAGWRLAPPLALDAAALRALPSTWARRLAVGRDPRAVVLEADNVRHSAADFMDKFVAEREVIGVD